jgi:aspartyl-tRNA(Asn)/glutamyl-tRNA(Gln) amidotransferase subunit C
MITRKDIEKLATLSRLKLSDEEMTRMEGEMGSILAYVDTLKSATAGAAGGGVVPTMSVNKNVLREDANAHEGGLYTKKLVEAAPKHQGDFVQVKKIL